MTKVCTVCKIEKPRDSFSPRKDSKCGIRSACRLCHNGRSHKNKGYEKYHLTQDEYDSILKSQDGVCAICKTSGPSRGLCVDHCHDSGKVRGILCHTCNIKLTRRNYPSNCDNFDEKAAEYLAGSQKGD